MHYSEQKSIKWNNPLAVLILLFVISKMRGRVEEIENKNPKGASKQDIVSWSWRDKTHFPTV